MYRHLIEFSKTETPDTIYRMTRTKRMYLLSGNDVRAINVISSTFSKIQIKSYRIRR